MCIAPPTQTTVVQSRSRFVRSTGGDEDVRGAAEAMMLPYAQKDIIVVFVCVCEIELQRSETVAGNLVYLLNGRRLGLKAAVKVR